MQQRKQSKAADGSPQHDPNDVQPHSRPPVAIFLARQALGLGVTSIIIGVACVAFNAVGLGISEWFSVVVHGIWCGVTVSLYAYSATISLICFSI